MNDTNKIRLHYLLGDVHWGGHDVHRVAEFLIVDHIPRRRIFSLIGLYRAGTHIGDDGKPVAAIADVLRYIHATKISVSGMDIVCLDGEIETAKEIDIAVVPDVLRYMV